MNDCAGEVQQQFIPLTESIKSQSVPGYEHGRREIILLEVTKKQ
jgi:hypothetical protein